MEGEITFDVNGLLTPEEAQKFWDEGGDTQAQEPEKEGEQPDTLLKEVPAEENAPNSSERVGSEEIQDQEEEGDAETQKGDGSSPTFYSSIAKALKNDGVSPDFPDEEIDNIKTAEDFSAFIEKMVDHRLGERERRIYAAINTGIPADTVRQYEQTLQYLASIGEDALNAEGKEADDLRSQLIYNDLINRGFEPERAQREVEKSMTAGTDKEDAKDALNSLGTFYATQYDNLQKEAKAKADAAERARKEDSEKFRKMLLDDEVKFGNSVLDKKTKQQVFDAVTRPVYKDPDTGQLLTQVQKMQKENPLEFLKQLGLWFVLTEGGKNTGGLVNSQVRQEKNKSIRELERKINTSQLDSDGSLRYMGSQEEEKDLLLSDDWKVGFPRQ